MSLSCGFGLMHSDVLVVGAGQAGAQLALSLRLGGYAGSITLIGAEPDLPYERPPLSKEYLVGERPAAELHPIADEVRRQADAALVS